MRTLRLVGALVALLAVVAAAPSVAADDDARDFALRAVPESADSTANDRTRTKFVYMFGQAARWNGVFAWRYNPANAPAAYAKTSTAVAALTTALDKWTAVCGFRHRYDGVTSTRPNQRVATATGDGPDFENVVGWDASLGAAGSTEDWYGFTLGGARALVDADMTLSPVYVNSAYSMSRVATHEWGHALGLSHSNVDAAIMAGPPDTDYNGLTTLQSDDIRGCRCLYGMVAGQQAGYSCSMPRLLDFGQVALGVVSTKTVPFSNDGSAALTVGAVGSESEVFRRTAGCDAGTVLTPGQSCTIVVAATPASLGSTKSNLVLQTSDGVYLVPLAVQGVAATAAANYGGTWWNAPAESESGWGLTLQHEADFIFANWYTYDANGRALWLSMGATKSAPGVYSGALYQTRGPAFNSVPFNPDAVSRTTVGSGTLTFDANGGGTFAYTVNGISQAKSITRVQFAALPTCTFGALQDLSAATNYQAVWWAAPAGSESGWGLNLTQQAGTIAVLWYTYDLDGAPLWLSAAASNAGGKTFSGTLYRSSGPAFFAAPFNSALVVRVPVGNLTLTFANGNSATFAYTVNGVAQTKTITRAVVAAPGTVCQ